MPAWNFFAPFFQIPGNVLNKERYYHSKVILICQSCLRPVVNSPDLALFYDYIQLGLGLAVNNGTLNNEDLHKANVLLLFHVKEAWGLPGGPVAKTPCSQCQGPGFDPWSGN